MTSAGEFGVRLFAVTDTTSFPDCIEQAADVCQAARSHSVAVVLREREVSGQKLHEWARTLRAVTARYSQKLFVADRLDLAVLVGADGVHLPSFGLSPRSVSREAAPWVSRSGHGLLQLSPADFARTSAFWVSPVGAVRKGRPALGETGLRQQVQWIKERAPHAAVYALGGISARLVPECARAGAAGVAAIGAVWSPSERFDLLHALGIIRTPAHP